eukprot:15463839-Alexandrium_andersonii.AAC.1
MPPCASIGLSVAIGTGVPVLHPIAVSLCQVSRLASTLRHALHLSLSVDMRNVCSDPFAYELEALGEDITVGPLKH